MLFILEKNKILCVLNMYISGKKNVLLLWIWHVVLVGNKSRTFSQGFIVVGQSALISSA